jgi:hypothetical protein
MNPEPRTTSPVARLTQGRWKKAGRLALLALVVTVGMLTAVAAKPTPRPAQTASGRCTDIDAVQASTFTLRAAVTDGITYAGIREVSAIPPPNVPFRWTDLSTFSGYPKNVCSVSINIPQGGTILIDALTRDGLVFETFCTHVFVTDQVRLSCRPWAPMHSPTPGASNS